MMTSHEYAVSTEPLAAEAAYPRSGASNEDAHDLILNAAREAVRLAGKEPDDFAWEPPYENRNGWLVEV